MKKTEILKATLACSFDGGQGKWNLLFPMGTYHGANLASIGGSITIDSTMLAEMVKNWQDAGRPKLPVRKTHRHLDDDVPAVDRLELEAAYGFLADFRVTPQGLEALTEWNDAGTETVASKTFAYWSPEWQPKHRDRKTGEVKGWWISGTALTNDPFFNEMPQVAATSAQVNGENMDFKKKIAAALKMPEDSTDEDLCAACEAACKPATASAEEVAKLTAAAVEPVTASLVAANASLEKANGEVATLKAKIADQEVAALIATAKSEGRAVDPLKSFITEAYASGGTEKARKLIETAPVVPLTPVGVKLVEAPVEGGARAKFDALVAEAVKSGMSSTEAYRTVTAANKELATEVFNTK